MTLRGRPIDFAGWATLIAVAIGVVVSSLPTVARADARRVYTTYSAVEHQPLVPVSGRVNDVAIDPSDRRHVLATSESGGLWRSRDAGVTWTSAGELPAFNLNAVQFLTTNGAVVVVTARGDAAIHRHGADGFVTSGGGIWLSRDGGATWTHPAGAIPSLGASVPADDRSCPPAPEAFGLAQDRETGRVFVATNCGVSYSDDLDERADARWRHVAFPRLVRGPADRVFAAVAALEGDGVVLVGGGGLWRSANNGGDWELVDGAGGNSVDFHAATGIVGLSGAALLVTRDGAGATHLRLTRDGGATWTEITSAPPNPLGAGGVAHVYAQRDDLGFIVHYGNSFGTYSRLFGPDLETLASESWASQRGTHEDTRAMAFSDGGRPIFLASDGGLDRAVAGRWTAIGSGPGRLNALQLYDVEGQRDRDGGGYRLAIGTQDNGFRASPDERSWPATHVSGPEGGGIQMARVASGDTSPRPGTGADPDAPTRLDWPGVAVWSASAADSWTWTTSTGALISSPYFLGWTPWPGYVARVGWGFAPPRKILDPVPGAYVHTVFPNPPLWSAEEQGGIELTLDFGETYRRIWRRTPADEPWGHPVLVGDTIYQASLRGENRLAIFEGEFGFKDVELLRVSAALSGEAPIAEYPAMNGFGGFGFYGFGFAYNPVFAVNPGNGRHLIAPDAFDDNAIKVSTDGGETWSPIDGLARLVSSDGSYRLVRRSPYGDFSYSLVSAVSFYPDNPDLVVLGSEMGGAHTSTDGGVTWRHVGGSNGISNIVDFHWKSATEIYAASYGRGLWRLEGAPPRFRVRDLMDVYCEPGLCDTELPFLRNIQFGAAFVDAFGANHAASKAPPLETMHETLQSGAFDTVVLVVDGELRSVGSGSSLAEQLRLSPGAIALTFSDTGQSPTSIRGATPTADRMALALAALPPDPSGVKPVVKGLVLRGKRITGLIVGAPAVHRPPQRANEEFPKVERTSPAPSFDRGHLLLHPSGPTASNDAVYWPDGTLPAAGHGFAPGLPVSIEIDSRAVTKNVVPDKTGAFRIEIPLKGVGLGAHVLRASQELSDAGRDTDERVFFIRHLDKD